MFPEEKTGNFRAKGLGWIPDYPDARDYQLSNEIFEKLGEVTGREYFEGINFVLKQLKEKLGKPPAGNTNSTDPSEKILSYLEQELEKFDFPEVKVYRVLRSGSHGKEVTLLKYCLTRFYQEELKPLAVKDPQSENDSALKAIKHLHKFLGGKLSFLDEPQENWRWLSQMSFDEPGTTRTKILVEAFQIWADLEGDGDVGLNTYAALEKWMSQSDLEQEQCIAGSGRSIPQSIALPIPFPAPISSKLLQTIFSKLLSQNEEKSWKNDTYEKDVEEIAQEYFLIVEPIISVITEILGPIGAYKDIETAIESAVGKFLSLLNLKSESQLDKLLDLPNLTRVSSSDKFERFQLSKDIGQNITVLDLKFLGSSEKLPDHLLSELREDLNNLKNLRKVAHQAVKTYRNRLNNEKLYSANSIRKLLQRIDESLKTREDTCEEGISSQSIILELVPKLPILDKIEQKESRSATENNLIGTSNEPTQFFSKYRIPSGTNLLKNLRNEWQKHLEESKEHSPTDWQTYWIKRASSIRVFTYLPNSVDLSFWCSPISDQGALKSCSAHAGAALVEYFSKRYLNDYKPVSTRFLYKIARNLMDRKGDTGASLRETIKAMVTFGIPPETYWRYEENNFDEEPTSFCYSFAQNYQTLNYFRLDHSNVSNNELLTRIKIALAAGFPCMFGFTIHKSIYDPFNVKRGYIPYPGKPPENLIQADEVISGHAVVAVGYHDYKQIKQSNSNAFSTGALLIRNSWGTQWGLSGYGWLPYDYVLNGLTADWWSLVESKWLETGKFGLGGTKDSVGKDDGQKGT